MKTIKNKRKSQAWSSERLPHVRSLRDETTETASVRDVQRVPPNLVESAEYEWTTAVNLPGLIVPPARVGSAPSITAPVAQRATNEIIETEDGDGVSPCQLPGGLTHGDTEAFAPCALGRINAGSEGEDEYSAAAAMQLPGVLVVGAADPVDESASVRGLCATCVHHATCDFPRPAGGVWRCEEYS
jgi:hypothetical protein